MDRQELGKEGEKKAIDFLKKKGYRILEKNYRKQIGEIDIIAEDPKRDEIVFVEVKTRRGTEFGYPEESINKQKIKRIHQVGDYWLNEKGRTSDDWRIDILSLEWDQVKIEIKHFENIE